MSTDLAVIEAALKAATPGPWAVCPWYPQGVMPKAWADDQLPVEERGPFMSTGTVGDGADVGTERPERIADDIDRLRNAEESGRWWGFYGLGLVVAYGAAENWPLVAVGLALAVIGLTTCAGSDHYARQAEAELKAIVDGAA